MGYLWDLTPCSFVEVTDVSEERDASLFRVKEEAVCRKREVQICSLVKAKRL